MAQISLRIPDDLADDLKAEARNRNLSVNRYLTLLVSTAVNPELAGDEADRLRERFRRAGLLEDWPRPAGERPDPEQLERAKASAKRGTPLSELVSEGRD